VHRSPGFHAWVDLLAAEWIVPSESAVCASGGLEMSSYASYCQDQITDCARRARLARSPEIATYWQGLAAKLVEACRAVIMGGGALGNSRKGAEVTRIARQLPSGTRLIISRTFGTIRPLVKD
jgi:hypothetical protein